MLLSWIRVSNLRNYYLMAVTLPVDKIHRQRQITWNMKTQHTVFSRPHERWLNLINLHTHPIPCITRYYRRYHDPFTFLANNKETAWEWLHFIIMSSCLFTQCKILNSLYYYRWRNCKNYIINGKSCLDI